MGRAIRLLGGVATGVALGALAVWPADAGLPMEDTLFEALPPPEPGCVRLGVDVASEVELNVSIRRDTERCGELEAHVEVLSAGLTGSEGSACFGADHPEALIELVVGHGAGRDYYRLEFGFSVSEDTVSYTLRRVSGAGIIESQKVVVDAPPAPEVGRAVAAGEPGGSHR